MAATCSSHCGSSRLTDRNRAGGSKTSCSFCWLRSSNTAHALPGHKLEFSSYVKAHHIGPCYNFSVWKMLCWQHTICHLLSSQPVQCTQPQEKVYWTAKQAPCSVHSQSREKERKTKKTSVGQLTKLYFSLLTPFSSKSGVFFLFVKVCTQHALNLSKNSQYALGTVSSVHTHLYMMNDKSHTL